MFIIAMSGGNGISLIKFSEKRLMHPQSTKWIRHAFTSICPTNHLDISFPIRNWSETRIGFEIHYMGHAWHIDTFDDHQKSTSKRLNRAEISTVPTRAEKRALCDPRQKYQSDGHRSNVTEPFSNDRGFIDRAHVRVNHDSKRYAVTNSLQRFRSSHCAYCNISRTRIEFHESQNALRKLENNCEFRCQ